MRNRNLSVLSRSLKRFKAKPRKLSSLSSICSVWIHLAGDSYQLSDVGRIYLFIYFHLLFIYM